MKLKLNHLLIPYLALLGFLFAGFVSSTGVAWYQTLQLPAGHPTLALIALIWAVIFICATWSLLYIWNTVPKGAARTRQLALFGVIVAANMAWSVEFFVGHLLGASVWIALVIGVLALALAGMLARRSPSAALLMLPYAAWVLYAAHLTSQVAALNP